MAVQRRVLRRRSAALLSAVLLAACKGLDIHMGTRALPVRCDLQGRRPARVPRRSGRSGPWRDVPAGWRGAIGRPV
jgi:hypothetical protein